ncbi:MAG: hypothetical protein V4654_14575 [Bdellovibrionota bacterium]
MIFRSLLFVSLLFLSVNASAANNEVQIYVPGIQFRYEEGSDQHVDLRSYTHYAINYMYQSFMFGLEYNTHDDNTGSISLGVKSKIKELNVLAGFSLAKLELNNLTPNTNIEIMGFVLAGKSENEIETSLNGQSQTNSSEKQSVLGVGGLAFFRLDYFIAGFDTRWMQSSAYQPKSVSVSTIKLGVNFKF